MWHQNKYMDAICRRQKKTYLYTLLLLFCNNRVLENLWELLKYKFLLMYYSILFCSVFWLMKAHLKYFTTTIVAFATAAVASPFVTSKQIYYHSGIQANLWKCHI